MQSGNAAGYRVMDADRRLGTPGPQTRTLLQHSRGQELHCCAHSSCPSSPTRVTQWACVTAGEPQAQGAPIFCNGLQANWLTFSLETHLSLLYLVLYLSFGMRYPTHMRQDGEGTCGAFLQNDKNVLKPLKTTQERSKILVIIYIEKNKKNKKYLTF